MSETPTCEPSPVDVPVFAGRVVFDDEALVVSPDVVDEFRLRRKRWSPSSHNTFRDCPARWAGRILREEPHWSQANAIGTAVHWVLECLYGQPVALRTPEWVTSFIATLETQAKHLDAVPSTEAELAEWKAIVTARTMKVFELEDPTSIVVLGRERSLDTARVNGVPFNGKVDRTILAYDEAGHIIGPVVDDWKSSASGMKADFLKEKFGDAHGDQGRLYALALHDLDGRLPSAVRILYTATGQAYPVDTSDAELNRVAQQFKSSFDLMLTAADTGRYPVRESYLCKWCPMWSVCPGAERYRDGLVRPATPRIPDFDLAERKGIEKVKGQPSSGTVNVSGNQPSKTPNFCVERFDMAQRFSESKPWDSTGPAGLPNGSGYAATGAFGMVDLAVEQFVAAERPITIDGVRALAQAFTLIVAKVQSDLGASTDPMEGLNTRLRGCLRSALDHFPVPFDGTVEQWEQWHNKVGVRMTVVGNIAADILTQPLPDAPWSTPHLATMPDTASTAS